jgi:two-component system response regulator YesN
VKRVLIVDDEYLVRLGLKTTIDWEAHGYRIVGEAANGKEALELFDLVKPDILMTDIKMAVMDGLELLSGIKEMGRRVQVVILSNYDDFSYARKAMALGASRYLLKSEISESTLIEMLHSLRLEEKEDGGVSDDLESARRKYLQEQLFGFSADANIDPALLSPPPPELFPNPPYIAIKCGCLSPTFEDAPDMPLKTLQSIVASSFDFEDVTCCTAVFKSSFYLTMLCSVKKLEPQYMERMKEHCRMMIRNIHNYLDFEVRLGLSALGDGMDFPKLLAQAEEARKYSFFTQNSITVYKERSAVPNLIGTRVNHSKVKRLVGAKNRAHLTEYIHQVFSKLEAQRYYPAVKSAFVDFLSVAKSICDERNLDLSTGLNEVKFDYDNLSRIPSLEHAKLYLLDIYSTILDAIHSNNSSYSYTIRKCMEYIEENYALNISQEDVAKAVEISSSYLSMIFKQETGINFVAYLNKVRIEKAKELLKGTNLKIYEIAEKVGFASPYYFSRVFKDLVGCSCKEYRDELYNS